MDLMEFAGNCAAAADEVSANYHIGALILTDEADQILVGTVLVQSAPEAVSDIVEEMTVGHRGFLGVATRASYSPDDGPSSPAWQLTCVSRDEPAVFLVRRILEDEKWTLLRVARAPWFALSTASSLCKALDGERPVIRNARGGDERLFSRLDQGTPPPKQADGRM